MKKIISAVLAVIMLLSLAALVGCAGCNEPGNGEGTTTAGGGNTDTPKPEFETVNEEVYATAAVRVRSSASIESEDNIVATLVKGQKVIRIGYNEEWSLIKYNSAECYVSSKYLSTTKPDDVNDKTDDGVTETNVPDDEFTPCDNEQLYVCWKEGDNWLKEGTVNVREVPNWDAPVATALKIGTKVTRVAVYYEKDGEITGLSKILVGDKTYYISNRALSEVNYAEAATTTN